MGFDSTAIRFFLSCKEYMGDISSTMVLGRQSFTPPIYLHRGLINRGLVPKLRRNPYCDDFFAGAGIRSLDYLDLSDYQGANILHDLSKPVPSHLVGQYDLVIDAGTLEHIPDFLLALQNTMQMVKKGGFLLVVAPGNNFLGHGCYQLSPEIFHRVLSRENGFDVKISLVHELGPFGGRWRNVPDSQIINSRVDIPTRRTTYVCIVAQRISTEIGLVGHQSDYENIWKQEPSISKLGRLYMSAPYFLQRLAFIFILRWVYSLRSRKALKKVRTSGRLRLLELEEFWH